MPPPDSLLTKVRKLLAQAEDPACTPQEAEAFTAKAAALVARHGIDVALLAAADPRADRVGDVVVDLLAPYAREKASLGSAVAQAMRCEAVLRTRRSYDDRLRATAELSLHVFGHGSRLGAFEILFASLLVQGTRALGGTRVPWGEHVAAFRRTWWLGFAEAIADRLREGERSEARESEAQFAARGTSAGLVLADQAARAQEAMQAAYPHLRTAGPRLLSGGGAASGWASGQRADLGTGRLRGEGARELG